MGVKKIHVRASNTPKSITFVATTMQRAYNILRAVLAVVIALPPILAVAFYILLSLPWAQDALRNLAQKELEHVLGTEVSIEAVAVSPFDRIDVRGVAVKDDFGENALVVGNISAGIDLGRLIGSRRIVIDYASVIGLKALIYRDTPESPLNISGILAKLIKKDDRKSSPKFDLKINTVIVEDASMSYEVKSDTLIDVDRFSPNHIGIEDLNLIVNIPVLSDKRICAYLEGMRFRERSGLRVEDISVNVDMGDTLCVTDFRLALPNSLIQIGAINVSQIKSIGRFPHIDVHGAVDFDILEGSHVTPCDLKCFLPCLEEFITPIDVTLTSCLTKEGLTVSPLVIKERKGALSVKLEALSDKNLFTDSMNVKLTRLEVGCDGGRLSRYISSLAGNNAGLVGMISRLGGVAFNAKGHGDRMNATLEGSLSCVPGSLDFALDFSDVPGKSRIDLRGTLDVDSVDMSIIMPELKCGIVDGELTADVKLRGKAVDGNVSANLYKAEYLGYAYSNIHVDVEVEDKRYDATVNIDDSNLRLNAEGYVDMNPHFFSASLLGNISDFRPDILNLNNKYPGYALSAEIDVNIGGEKMERTDGYISLKNISFLDEKDSGVRINKVLLKSNVEEEPYHMDLESDFINGHLTGDYDTKAFLPMAKGLAYTFMPILADSATIEKNRRFIADSISNNFNFEIEISPCEDFCRFFSLPVTVISPVNINGEFDYGAGSAMFELESDWIQQGNKIFMGSYVRLSMDRADKQALLYVTTSFDTKKGLMTVALSSTASNNNIDSKINWEIKRAIPINGTIGLLTTVMQGYRGLLTDVHFRPGVVTFGDILWNIEPSDIIYEDGVIDVRNFRLTANDERLSINGRVSANPEDKLVVDLQSVEMIDIFETLEIDKALIGGKATGRVTASSLLTKQPIISAESLKIKNISYNYARIGDANVSASWNREKESFALNADVNQPNGHTSRIFGDIYATRDSLDINFDTSKVNIGFLKPFMAAFADEVGGEASGKAHLFGTFKNVDLEGDLWVDSVTLKLGYTNTAYTVKDDSLHISPGEIKIDNVRIYDMYGNTANLSGWLRHNFFHDPSFNFQITDARNLLCYDVTPKLSPRWYGRIFGNSDSRKTIIRSTPGEVVIDAAMTTTGKSNFTFALLNQEDASEYTFLKFRDNTIVEIDSLIDIEDIPMAVKEAQAKRMANNEDASSKVVFNLDVDVTPSTKMKLLMDPVSGDSIVAYGKGRLEMHYNSATEDLSMLGTYTLDRGNYNFSMQDIFHKNFIINSGSSVTFKGDPYDAQIDIVATYATQASLNDLDESFAMDGKGSQSVPTHAILKVKGSIQAPTLEFDLNFPTLEAETIRKINSIINTQDILQRQIAYLITLNRFYTPDYMSGTRGNELVSVASSTLSSQISNMLGQLSDKWRIAPSVRSDRGDFSDVEVDLTLSSNLLNNRLIFNGNFGYRDKSLNTNQFVGDFDIEYLLNPRGSWRLKAYNRYNDQNYYLRSAATTQGIGIVYKKDFDNMFQFLRRKKKKPEDKDKGGEKKNVTKSGE